MQSLCGFARSIIYASERYLKTDITYIIKNGFWLSIGQGVALVSSFALSVVFANTLPKEVYGNYKFILSATGILGAMSLTGLGTVVTQAVARGKEGVMKDAIKTQQKWSVLIVAASIIIGFYYFSKGNATLFYSFIVAGLAFPITNAYSLYGSFLNGKKDFKASTLYWSISQIINVAVLIVTSLITHNIFLLVLAYFLSNALTTLFFYKFTIATRHMNTEKDDSIIRYGIHISAMNIFGTLANQLDKILVFHYLGAVQLAVYSFSFAIPEQIKGSYKNLFTIALPKYAEKNNTDLRRSVVKKSIQLTFITLLIVVAYILLAPLVYKLFFPKYLEAVWYSQVYSLGLLSIPCISLLGTYFQLEQSTKVLYKLTTISNVVTIVLTFILIYKYGLTGAVIENGISWLIMMLCYIYFFVRMKKTA